MKDRSMQPIIIIIILIFWAIPVTAGNASTNETVVIGILHSETFTYAEMMRNSFELALKKINESGGINGKTLKLVYEDDQGKPDVGEESVKRMKDIHNAVMLVGGYSSTNTLRMARKADQLDIPFLVCTAADDRITQRDLKNIFRLNPPAKEYTQGLEQFLIQKVKPESMSIIYENSPYGTSSAMRMMSFCRNHDINISKIIPYYREKAGIDYFNRIMAPLETFLLI